MRKLRRSYPRSCGSRRQRDIPIGKLQLYTACAGVPSKGLLPILLDFGTNNRELLSDSLYLGLRQTRPSLEEVDPFVDEFVEAVQEHFKDCCIHFEDWKGTDPFTT